MIENRDQTLLLENQLCFKLYEASKLLISKYLPVLEKLNLTYTQYLVMLLLWENEVLKVKEIGNKLSLDSGTLTPLLSKLQTKGYIKKCRSKTDKRDVFIKITDLGQSLKEEAYTVPEEICKCLSISEEEGITLYQILDKLIEGLYGK